MITIETLLTQQNELLSQIVMALSELKPKAPATLNMIFPIEEFAEFEWSQIGTRVVKADEYGPTIVERDGQQYRRRSPQNKFGAAIWFSRCVGKDESGQANAYEKLISFVEIKDEDIDPLSANAVRAIERRKKAAPTATQAAASQPATASAKASAPATTKQQPELEAKRGLVETLRKQLDRLGLKDGSIPVRELVEKEWQCEWSANVWYEADVRQLQALIAKLADYKPTAPAKPLKLDSTLFWQTCLGAGIERSVGQEIVTRHTQDNQTDWAKAQANLVFRIALKRHGCGDDVAKTILQQAGGDYAQAAELINQQFGRQTAAA